jgi:hypothetical protein
MMSLLARILLPLVILSLIEARPSLAGEVDVAASWVAQHCEEVEDAIFAEPESWESFIDADRPLVVVSLGGEFILDTQVALFFASDHLVTEITQAKGEPLCQQLEALKNEHLDLDGPAAIPLVKVRRLRVTRENNNALFDHYQALRHVQISAWPAEAIFAPGRGATVEIRGTTGAVNVSYTEPEPLADSVAFTTRPDSPQPELAAWVQRLLGQLNLDLSFRPEEPSDSSPLSSCPDE